MPSTLPEVRERDSVDRVIDRDLACEQCGYDLRGLTPPGNCPECGLRLEASLNAEFARHAAAERARADARLTPLAARLARARFTMPPTPWEAREVAGGCAALLAAVVPILLFALAPVQWEQFRGGRRHLLLAPLAAAWVLSWCGTWKLTRGERRSPGGGRTDPSAEPLRRYAGCHAAIPFLAGVFPALSMLGGADWRDRAVAGEFFYFAFATGLGVAILLPLRLRRLASRLGNRRLAREASVLVGLTPMMGFLSLHLGQELCRNIQNSLDLLGVLPQYPFGPPLLYRALMTPASPVRTGDAPVVALAILCLAGWYASVLWRLALAHVRHLRSLGTGAQRHADGPVERPPARARRAARRLGSSDKPGSQRSGDPDVDGVLNVVPPIRGSARSSLRPRLVAASIRLVAIPRPRRRSSGGAGRAPDGRERRCANRQRTGGGAERRRMAAVDRTRDRGGGQKAGGKPRGRAGRRAGTGGEATAAGRERATAAPV